MKTLDKLFVLASALLLTPAAALAQQAAPAPQSAPAATAPQGTPAPPTDAISARSQAAPATPDQSTQPNMASSSEPSNAQVAQSTMAARATPTPGIGQPDGRAHLQEQFTPI